MKKRYIVNFGMLMFYFEFSSRQKKTREAEGKEIDTVTNLSWNRPSLDRAFVYVLKFSKGLSFIGLRSQFYRSQFYRSQVLVLQVNYCTQNGAVFAVTKFPPKPNQNQTKKPQGRGGEGFDTVQFFLSGQGCSFVFVVIIVQTKQYLLVKFLSVSNYQSDNQDKHVY